MTLNKKAIYILISMLLLVPLGLLSESPAWGEWDNEYYEKAIGFIPQGIKNAQSIKAFIPDYSVNGVGNVTGYYISALIGILLIFGIFYFIAKVNNNAKHH